MLGNAGKDTLNGGKGTDRIHPGAPETGNAKISDKTRVLDSSLAFDFDALLVGLLKMIVSEIFGDTVFPPRLGESENELPNRRCDGRFTVGHFGVIRQEIFL